MTGGGVNDIHVIGDRAGLGGSLDGLDPGPLRALLALLEGLQGLDPGPVSAVDPRGVRDQTAPAAERLDRSDCEAGLVFRKKLVGVFANGVVVGELAPALVLDGVQPFGPL